MDFANVCLLFAALYVVAEATAEEEPRVPTRMCSGTDKTVYDFIVQEPNGKNVSLKKFEGKQEPGENHEEIMNGIRYVRPGNDFTPSFPIMEKIEVNGENHHPLYKFLKETCPQTQEHYFETSSLMYEPLRSNDIRWNFEKFLINKEGQPILRIDASTLPYDIVDDIDKLISTSKNNKDHSN